MIVLSHSKAWPEMEVLSSYISLRLHEVLCRKHALHILLISPNAAASKICAHLHWDIHSPEGNGSNFEANIREQFLFECLTYLLPTPIVGDVVEKPCTVHENILQYCKCWYLFAKTMLFQIFYKISCTFLWKSQKKSCYSALLAFISYEEKQYVHYCGFWYLMAEKI